MVGSSGSVGFESDTAAFVGSSGSVGLESDTAAFGGSSRCAGLESDTAFCVGRSNCVGSSRSVGFESDMSLLGVASAVIGFVRLGAEAAAPSGCDGALWADALAALGSDGSLVALVRALGVSGVSLPDRFGTLPGSFGSGCRFAAFGLLSEGSWGRSFSVMIYLLRSIRHNKAVEFYSDSRVIAI